MSKNCIVCASNNLIYFAKKDGYDFLTCKECALIFIDPMPDANTLISDFYSKKAGYHAHATKDMGNIKTGNKKIALIANKLSELKFRGNLLDVGCSYGEFLFLAKKIGFTAYGVEVNKDTSDIAISNGFTVFNGTLESAKFESNYFSVIYLGDVIEHVTNPDILLQECHRILKKGGVMVVATPNTDCFWVRAIGLLCRLCKFPWSTLIPPYHVFIFSKANATKFLEKFGFGVLEITYRSCLLRHELGSTKLLRDFLNKKSFKTMAYMVVVFSSYVIVYGISILTKVFLKKDYEMIIFANKQ